MGERRGEPGTAHTPVHTPLTHLCQLTRSRSPALPSLPTLSAPRSSPPLRAALSNALRNQRHQHATSEHCVLHTWSCAFDSATSTGERREERGERREERRGEERGERR
eukprot:1362488-Rhodomonas_salina.2